MAGIASSTIWIGAVRAAITHGDALLGIGAVDGIRYAELEKDHAVKILSGPRSAPRPARIYDDRDQALAAFRLMPPPLRPIEERFVLEHIARHSIGPAEGGWASKFDTALGTTITLGFELKDALRDLRCHAAILYGEDTHPADETASAAIMATGDGRAVVFTIPGTPTIR